MGNSTWLYRAKSGEWNKSSNWESKKVPTHTASFGASTQTEIDFAPDNPATVKQIEFQAGAPPYNFVFGPETKSPALTIKGAGVINKSASQQSFVVASRSTGPKNPQLKFTHKATAGGNDIFYSAGPTTRQDYGGGVISFCDSSTAGSASFVAWTGAAAPPEDSTVGGEVSFNDQANAGTARFTIYGSLGTDGDTFGNVVFHDSSNAANAIFTNIGGTVSGGDGGNTQFYDNANAAYGAFHNCGATHNSGNGGDVAFDGTSNGGNGYFHNYPATVAGGNGGVTSFNNNANYGKNMPRDEGASAGCASYVNYGARQDDQAGGGHTEFTAQYGSPTAANARIVNHGSELVSSDPSSAGHTIFSISISSKYQYFPTAGEATICNYPGIVEGAAAGFTEFTVYTSDYSDGGSKTKAKKVRRTRVPTADSATIINLGGTVAGADGGYTTFKETTTAENAQLIAYGGISDGWGGQITFYDNSTAGSAQLIVYDSVNEDGGGRVNFQDDSSGGSSTVQLIGNGTLNIAYHNGRLKLATLEATGGIIQTQIGWTTTRLTLREELKLNSSYIHFFFVTTKDGGFDPDETYTILTAPNLSDFDESQFRGNDIDGMEPYFKISGRNLKVSFWPAE